MSTYRFPLALAAALAALAAPFGFALPQAQAQAAKKDLVIPVNAEKFTDYEMRGNLMRSFNVFKEKKAGRIAYMGGSVTTRQWRIPLQKWIEQQFPDTQFDYVMAGIGGTPAGLGAFRVEEDVFKKGKVDLFFLEFAVNGGNVREMEGIVRHAKRLNPDIDIVLMYFANTGHVKSYDKGEIPKLVVEHEKVAAHYDLPGIFLYREIARRIEKKQIVWKDFSGDSVHPNQKGCDMYAACLIDFLAAAWSDPTLAAKPAELPKKLDPFCLERGHYVSLEKAEAVEGFTWQRKWKPTQRPVNFRGPVDIFTATEPGATLTLKFNGTAVGIYYLAGEDTGAIEYSIDGGKPVKVEMYHHAYGHRFILPRLAHFSTELKDGPHTLTLKVLDENHKKSKGHVVRLMKFLVN